MTEQDHTRIRELLETYRAFLSGSEVDVSDLRRLQQFIQQDIEQLEQGSDDLSCGITVDRVFSGANSTSLKNMVMIPSSLEIVLEQIDAIYLEGDTTGVHTVLGRTEQILGYTVDDWMSHPGGAMKFWEDHLHPDHKSVAEECLRLTEKGVDHEFVYRMIAKDGSTVWIHDKITVTKLDNGYVIQAFMIDITEKKAVELQMMEQNKFHEIGRIAMGIAHDFNNVLAGIVGYTSILGELVEEPEYSELLDGINRATDQAKQLSMNLLTYGKSHEKLVEVINVNDVLKNIKSLMRYKLVNQISVDLDLDADLKAIQADFSQITQVLLNLIVNAMEAVENNGRVSIATSNLVLDDDFVAGFEHRFPGNYIRVDITDTGPGIPFDISDQIFEPFYTTKRSGSGLGLSVVKNIVDSHEGIITYESEVGVGTTFSVYFPSIDQQVDEDMLEQMELHFGSGSLLCVDDNPLVRDIFDKVLSHLGYDVAIFSDGPKAIKYYEEHSSDIDAVLLDYIMPESRGDQLFEELKKINPDVKGIMVTGYGQEFDVNRIHEIGVDTILLKPFKMELLSQRIHELLS